MKEATCPNCGKPTEGRPANPYAPFCSRRCRMVDLGRWFGESYRVPGRPEESEDEIPSDRGRDEDDDR
ncbi:DNA gyrase inhibitor YacG [Vulgatibacter incomptus]|uniref:Uncharacterized protein n=1 Tax=Vulgatibacter incomptus TaxID=1391653 RepID=A0A0K1PCJ8_9BACT|nr:DNA gyrase inhibitor YacG [Vulgatibacter incomptus]AKU91222.1 hypothetical protein AKJ08_1609 [Vulgatibacter incomptus]